MCNKAGDLAKGGVELGCKVSVSCQIAKKGVEKAGGLAEDLADDAFGKFVQRLADGTQTAMAQVSSFWLKIPSPELAERQAASQPGFDPSQGEGERTKKESWATQKAISGLQNDLMPVAAAFAVISFAFALLRIAFSPEHAGEGLRSIGRQLGAVALATLPALAMTALLIEAGDEFAPWIVEQGAAGDADGLAKLMEVSITSGNAGIFLIVFLLALLGSIMQIMFMYIRGAAIIVLFVLLPIVAAGSATEEGWIRLKRMLMLILGFVLYKPVAAIIYAVGLKLVGDDTSGNEIQNAIYGMTVLCMAALALPAFIKFLMPIAAAGSSSVFSGGAAVGAVAGGAAVVALAAPSGGTSAVAGGASSTGFGGGGRGSETIAQGSGGAGGPAGGSGGTGGGAGGPGGGDHGPGAGGAHTAQPSSGRGATQTPAPASARPGAPAQGAPPQGSPETRTGRAAHFASETAANGAKTVRTAGDETAEGAER